MAPPTPQTAAERQQQGQQQCEIGRKLISLGKVLIGTMQDDDGIRAASREANDQAHQLARMVRLEDHRDV